MYLKKYLTEGLIQVAILLSLSGMRVDVDPHLPPLREIILGQSSALTQTQFHNLRNSLEGQDHHPKSVDLDGFFTARRLLDWVRSLDRLQLPTTELEAWLVHQEPEPLKPVSVQGGQMEGDSGLDDTGDLLSGLGLRMEGGEEGGGGIGELGNGQVAIDNNIVRGAVAPLPRGEQQDNSDNISKEDGDVLNFLWQQEADPGPQSEGPGYRNHRQPLEPLLSSFDDDDDRFRADIWTAGRHYHSHGEPPFGADVQQLVGPEGETSLSRHEHLQVQEDTFSFGQEAEHPDPELLGLDEEVSFTTGRPLLSPLISSGDPSMDLEQQWQDLLAIMEPQDMDLVSTALRLPVSNVEHAVPIGSINGLLHQDVSLHQASVPRVLEDAMEGLSRLDAAQTPSTQHHSSSIPSDGTFSFGSPDIADLFLPPEVNGCANGDSDLVDSALLINLLEEPALASPLRPLLEESMLNEISLMDLALEEGINPSEMCQLEEHLEDSDSGLSLNFSHSPASPSGSEASCSSSSSSSSSSSLSSTGSFSEEEGAVGYDPEYEDMEDSAEGAFGGYAAETSKVCGASYVEPSRFQHLPWLDSVSHDHTYNQPLFRNPEKPGKGCFEESPEVVVKDTFMGRDDRRARAMRVPFSTDHIINLPVEEFNMLLTRHKLSEAQLTLVRDIRRRGKNKMAAQNCRRRKLDVVVGLEHSVDGLRLRRARLLREKAEMYRSVREMKQRLNSLYEDVFSRLRDHEGRPYSDQDYSLQFNADGRVVLTSNHTSTESRCKSSKKQKDKRK